MTDFDPAPPIPGGVTVSFVSPGGIACRPFASGYVPMRVVLGHVDAEDGGLAAEVALGREPVPWASEAVRGEAIAELRRRARAAEGEDRAGLVRLLEHVRRTPHYEAA